MPSNLTPSRLDYLLTFSPEMIEECTEAVNLLNALNAYDYPTQYEDIQDRAEELYLRKLTLIRTRGELTTGSSYLDDQINQGRRARLSTLSQ